MLLFFMIMYLLSFLTGKELNLQALAGFLIPIATHSGHLLYTLNNSKNIVKAASNGTDVTKLQNVKNVLTGTTGETNVNTQ